APAMTEKPTRAEIERFFESTMMFIATEYDRFSKTIAAHQRALPLHEAQAINAMMAGFLSAQIEYLQSCSKMDASVFAQLCERVRMMTVVVSGAPCPQLVRTDKSAGDG